MTYTTKKVLLTVKAYPEQCRKLGYCVCIAGITDHGEFVRLYPVSNLIFSSNNFKKYTWFEVKCEKASEKLNRKESYHIDNEKINILNHIDSDNKWESRNNIILPLVSPSLEELMDRYEKDKTSLGIIKPQLIDFVVDDKPTEDEKDMIRYTQKTLYNEEIKPVDKIPFIFRYSFKCNANNCKGHKIMCEDWELLESWRKFRVKYGLDHAKQKIRERFFNYMKTRDLYFYMGMYSRYPTWLIIGLYYPPKRQIKPLTDF